LAIRVQGGAGAVRVLWGSGSGGTETREEETEDVSVLDLFAGPGGWDCAASDLGMNVLGIEKDDAACATRMAAALKTFQGDVAALDPMEFAPVEGLIASPPCQDFSVAGKGAGRSGERGRLIDEVPRWVAALEPNWIACEQVPPCEP